MQSEDIHEKLVKEKSLHAETLRKFSEAANQIGTLETELAQVHWELRQMTAHRNECLLQIVELEDQCHQ